MRERTATRPYRIKNQKERKDEEMARRRERAIRRPSMAAPKERKINPSGLDVRGAFKELEAILRQQESSGYSRTYRK